MFSTWTKLFENWKTILVACLDNSTNVKKVLLVCFIYVLEMRTLSVRRNEFYSARLSASLNSIAVCSIVVSVVQNN